MNVTNKKITIELSVRELDLLDLSVTIALADYWNKYTSAKNEDDKKSYFKTYTDLERINGELTQVRHN
jgi:hypothetical protein